VEHLLESYGLPLLFLLVAVESAGIPLPGETALIAAGVLASRGHLPIAGVIVTAALAAILGDNVGYWAGRKGGRRLLYRWERLERFADRALPPTERFFARHGGKAVVLARFVAGLRVTAAWMAGISRMRWPRFLFWNAAGGIAWAAGVGLAAYFLGAAFTAAVGRYGTLGALAGALVLAAVLAAVHFGRRRFGGAKPDGAHEARPAPPRPTRRPG
jgi:membrane protein DedA with SNARE-associated domain